MRHARSAQSANRRRLQSTREPLISFPCTLDTQARLGLCSESSSKPLECSNCTRSRQHGVSVQTALPSTPLHISSPHSCSSLVAQLKLFTCFHSFLNQRPWTLSPPPQASHSEPSSTRLAALLHRPPPVSDLLSLHRPPKITPRESRTPP